MVHITDYADFHEQDYYAPGDTGAAVYRTRHRARRCRHLLRPALSRVHAGPGPGWGRLGAGAQAGTVGEWPDGLYEAEMRVAAFQNGYFIGLCNRVGVDGSLTFAGESFICTPDGKVLAHRTIPGAEHSVLADLDLSSPRGVPMPGAFFPTPTPPSFTRTGSRRCTAPLSRGCNQVSANLI